MKELTIEEKSARYDEALALMQDCIPDEDGLVHVKPDEIFPELKESKDERIRKALIEYFNEQCDMSDWNGVYGYQVVAWLERQGGQKETLCDKCRKRTALGRCALEKQGEQKPVEWSEEDETTKNNISHIIRQYDKISKRENQPCYYVGDCLLWMQNIKDRVQPQPKQEWSEKNERTYKSITYAFAHNYPLTVQQQEFVKSLKDRYTWKPSDEQMITLRQVISGCSYDIEPLVEMEEQLKKLREE